MATTLYHGTRCEFTAFDDAMIGSNPETHDNSHLGIWFAVEDGWVGGFGSRVVAAEVELGRVYEMTVRRLAEMSRARVAEDEDPAEPFRALRRSLIAAGYDSIAIVESSGAVDMYVVLQARSIRAIRDLVPAGPAPR